MTHVCKYHLKASEQTPNCYLTSHRCHAEHGSLWVNLDAMFLMLQSCRKLFLSAGKGNWPMHLGRLALALSSLLQAHAFMLQRMSVTFSGILWLCGPLFDWNRSGNGKQSWKTVFCNNNTKKWIIQKITAVGWYFTQPEIDQNWHVIKVWSYRYAVLHSCTSHGWIHLTHASIYRICERQA